MISDIVNRRREWSVYLFLFGSGLSALIYQTAWFREFRLIFGASTAATAAVMGIFMGGVGWGSLLLGKRADRTPFPLRLYGRLEIIIAAAAAISPLLLTVIRAAYLALGGSATLGTVGAASIRLVLAALVLGVPTFLMGGTLPAAVAALQGRGQSNRQKVAACYAANAAGAVTGVMLATFWLLEHLGNRGALWLACGLNAGIAAAALLLARRDAPAVEDATDNSILPSAAPVPGNVVPPSLPASGLYAAAAITGFSFFLMELIWYRMLAPILGGSTFTFGVVLAVALSGIALGSLAVSVYLAKRPPTVPGFAWLCSAQAFCLAAPFALGDRLATWAMLMQPIGQFSFTLRVVQWTLIAAIVVLPASLLAGAQFPLLIALLGRGTDSIGKHTGTAYAWNTFGAILGSLAGGFGLLPILTAPGAWRFVVVLTTVLGAAFVILSWKREARAWGHRFALGLAAGALALIATTGPTAVWRHNPVGAGRTKIDESSRNDFERFMRDCRRSVVWEAEGRESSIALISDSGYAFLANGKSDGHSRGDAKTQVMSGLLGALLHPNPRDVCVIGLGTGSTAGWLAEVPTVRKVDVVELEPVIRRVAESCAAVNKKVLQNPKLHLTYNDAREALLTGRGRYDLIFSEPSNPYRAGVASLFSREFYQAVTHRLETNGLFLQWIQAYEIDGASISSICATLASVFNAVEVWQTQDGDLLLCATQEPLVYDLAQLQQRITEYPYREAMAQIWYVNGIDGLFARFVAGPELARSALAGGIPLNTDDCNRLEFALARSVGRDTAFSIRTLRQIAFRNGWERPNCINGELTSAAREERWATEDAVSDALNDSSSDGLTIGPATRMRAKQAFANGKLVEAADLWSEQTGTATDPYELLLVALTRAVKADPTTPEAIEQLRRWRPLDADAVEVHYLWHARKINEAIPRLEKLLSAWREFPWADDTMIRSTLKLIEFSHFSEARRPEALRIFHALDQRFAVQMHERGRINARLNLAQALDGETSNHFTVQVLETMEPNFPWVKDQLLLRAKCYGQRHSQLAAIAQADLARFRSQESANFDYQPQAESPRISARERR